MESFTSASYPGLETLKWLEPRLVAQMIKIEHPQTVAVVLAHLDPEQAGQVLGALPDHLKPDVSQRLATMEEVQPDILQHLSDSLQESLKGSGGPRAMTIGGAKMMAEIMTRLDKTTEATIMTKLTERDAALAETIRSLMFVFDDLVKLDDRAMPPEEAAARLEKLPPAMALQVLRSLKGKTAGTILASVKPDKAAKLTEQFLARPVNSKPVR